MDYFKIGIWTVTDKGIDCRKKHNDNVITYNIEKKNLNRIKDNCYDCLINVLGNDWLTGTELTELNTAFVFALDFFGTEFTKGVLKTTFFRQNEMLVNMKVNKIQEQIREIREKFYHVIIS